MQSYKERIFDLDDFRQGRHDVNKVAVFSSAHHLASLWTVREGSTLPMEKHDNSECIMLIMGGMGEYCDADGDTTELDADMMVVVPPDRPHEIRNTGIGPLVVLTIEGPVDKR